MGSIETQINSHVSYSCANMWLPFLSIHFSFSRGHVCVSSFVLILAVREIWVLSIFACGHVCESSHACSTEGRAFKSSLSEASVES